MCKNYPAPISKLLLFLIILVHPRSFEIFFLGEAATIVLDYCKFSISLWIILISWPDNFKYFRLKETARTGLWTHPTKHWLSLLTTLSNVVETWRQFGGLLCNKAFCWQRWAWKLSLTFPTIQILFPVTYSCFPRLRGTLMIIVSTTSRRWRTL